jgi:hypothetical protein
LLGENVSLKKEKVVEKGSVTIIGLEVTKRSRISVESALPSGNHLL